MTSFGRDDADLHDIKGGHLSAAHRRLPWRTRMEAHLELHRRVAASRPQAENPWEHGEHIPRQLRTPLAET
jgi:hypothetical protein